MAVAGAGWLPPGLDGCRRGHSWGIWLRALVCCACVDVSAASAHLQAPACAAFTRPPNPPCPFLAPAETHLLESGDADARCQVVRWVRTFPMAIIAQREYVIARRMFREAVRPGWCSSAGWVRSAGWAALELPASAFPALPCGGCTSVCFLSLGPLHPTSCLCRSILVQRRFSQLELI